MQLEAIILKNFRSYQEETRIPVSELTTFVGKNDVGKSSVLEALEIFFNPASPSVKIESADASVDSENTIVTIGCIFSGADDTPIVLDKQANTTLRQEYLLSREGLLEVRKEYDCSKTKIAPTTYVIANHPTTKGANDLLELKNLALKQRLQDLAIEDSKIQKSSNVSIRQGIYRHTEELSLQERQIDVDKEGDDVKRIWKQLEQRLPLFALFQADRPSKDDDPEVQDPMKLAVTEAIGGLTAELEGIKEEIRAKALNVANKTIEKLKEMDPTLAAQLTPNFRSEPKWENLFKLTLTGDDQVPINKRGSGVRRLILLNFFRADAERRRLKEEAPSVIYGIEEPETSQHPDNQKMLIEALKELANTENSQVILTTHVPGLAGLVPIESLRYITVEDGVLSIEIGEDDPEGQGSLYEQVSRELGVFPETSVRVLVCVEGPNDIEFLTRISRILHGSNEAIPDLSDSNQVAFLPVGGTTLNQWVQKRYLRNLGKPEVHIYDLDDRDAPPHRDACDRVNARGDGRDWATLTSKKTIENYLHPDAINDIFELHIEFSEDDDVPELVAQRVHEASESTISWNMVEEKKKQKKIAQAKRRLNTEVASAMTRERLFESDPNGDIESWLREISARL